MHHARVYAQVLLSQYSLSWQQNNQNFLTDLRKAASLPECPGLRVLRLVDSDIHPQTPFISISEHFCIKTSTVTRQCHRRSPSYQASQKLCATCCTHCQWSFQVHRTAIISQTLGSNRRPQLQQSELTFEAASARVPLTCLNYQICHLSSALSNV